MADRRGRKPRAAPKYNAIVASAAVMAQRPPAMSRIMAQADWMEEAWSFYDTNEALRFGVGWISNGLSRVNLVAASAPVQQGDEPTIIKAHDPKNPDSKPLTADELLAVALVEAIGGGAGGSSQMLAELAVLLSVPGIGWVLIEADTDLEDDADVPFDPDAMPAPDETWEWRVLSNNEIRTSAGIYEIREEDEGWRPVRQTHILVKVWRAHANKGWEADSPCRAVLGVLRQIKMLDEHVIATAQSRLAGAGLLILPSEIEFKPIVVRTPVEPIDPLDPDLEIVTIQEDDFQDTLVETAAIAIGDRGTAAAFVPLCVRVPGEYVDKVKHVTFWSEFNDTIRPLREEALTRLALGLDMPPEVLTGMSGVNHWTAWQVEETAITLHIEPLAEVICQALTIGYLTPAMEAGGGDASTFMVFYDTTDLTTRPDRSEDAIALYDRFEMTGSGARRESGLEDSDALQGDEFQRRVLLKLLFDRPELAEDILPALGINIVITPPPPPVTAPPPSDEQQPDEETGPPDQDTGGEPPGAALRPAASIMEACDGLVYRALEKANNRLRSAVGRRQPGGAAAIQCDDLAHLHTLFDATSFMRLDQLMDGAWTRVPTVAARLGLDPEALTATLDAYVRSLLATSDEHNQDRLANALGLALAA